MAASAFQTFLRYMELVAIYSFFMKFASSEQPGTDFTILACAELLAHLIGSSVALYLADKFGYADLFMLATVLSVLGITLTYFILRKLGGNTQALRVVWFSYSCFFLSSSQWPALATVTGLKPKNAWANEGSRDPAPHKQC